jgi:hypothetical protein
MVTVDEWGAMKGFPSIYQQHHKESVLTAAPSIHVWSILGDLILQFQSLPIQSRPPPVPRVPSFLLQPAEIPDELWSWECPNLSKGGPWYTR